MKRAENLQLQRYRALGHSNMKQSLSAKLEWSEAAQGPGQSEGSTVGPKPTRTSKTA